MKSAVIAILSFSLVIAAAPMVALAQQDRPMTVDEMEQAFGLKSAPAAAGSPKKPRFRSPTIELGGPSGETAPSPVATAAPSAPGAFSLRVEFNLNSAELASQYVDQMQQVALFMQRNPQVTVMVRGHTDATGDTAYNQTLSEQRARAVREFLISRGVPAGRLNVDGRGETALLTGEQPDSPRNRRVEFIRTDGR